MLYIRKEKKEEVSTWGLANHTDLLLYRYVDNSANITRCEDRELCERGCFASLEIHHTKVKTLAG